MIRHLDLARGFAAAASIGALVLAFVGWSQLPDRVPMHFSMGGAPDRWSEKSVLGWFAPPVIGVLIAMGFCFLLPPWLRGLARSNSTALNLPDRERFRALSEADRLRALDATLPFLCWIGASVALLVCWTTWGAAQVAAGVWQGLSALPGVALVFAIVALALGAVVAGKRAVARLAGDQFEPE